MSLPKDLRQPAGVPIVNHRLRRHLEAVLHDDPGHVLGQHDVEETVEALGEGHELPHIRAALGESGPNFGSLGCATGA